MSARLQCIETTHGEHPDAAVIWLHGLGADATDFVPAVAGLDLPAEVGIRFVFPNAPVRPVTINGGMKMRAWYDVDSDAGFAGGGEDIAVSTQQILRLVEDLVEFGIDRRRIVLAGFSQGGVIALYAGLGYERAIAGIVGLSTYLYDHERALERCSANNAHSPIFLAHGTEDPMIPLGRGLLARDVLRKGQYQVEWHTYPMGHGVCLEELRAMGHWLTTRLRSDAR